MASKTIKLPLLFETIEVAFQMVGRYIIWWTAYITTPTITDAETSALAAADLTYEAVPDTKSSFLRFRACIRLILVPNIPPRKKQKQ